MPLIERTAGSAGILRKSSYIFHWDPIKEIESII